MNDLINQVVTEIQYRGYSSNTQQAYTSHLTRMTKFFGRSLAEVSCDELNTYFQHPSVRRLSYATYRCKLTAWRFYINTSSNGH
jgi:site-specific recombinase XerD